MAKLNSGMSGESGGMARGINSSFADDSIVRARAAMLKNQSALQNKKIAKQNQDIVNQIKKLREGK